VSPEPDRRAILGARLLADARLREAAAVFLCALHEHGIAAAPIKGLVTSALLYDDPLDRPFGDVDVLVGRRDLPRVAAIARARGWPIVHDSKQLLTLNVVLPPGLPMDVRASVGPPLFATVAARQMLERASIVTDERVIDAPFHMLAGHDHLALLLLDAVFDKLAVRSELRKRDLARALRRWVASPPRFAEHLREAGLVAVAWLALSWLHAETGDARAREVLEALEPVPPLPRAIARRLLEVFRSAPAGPMARLGVRLVADHAGRGLAALALGAMGTALYHVRHRGRDPWEGRIWRGPGEVG
jgi:hypothetical protein